MWHTIIKILIVLNLPLAPLILARGLRLDRIFFAFYLVTFFLASYLLLKPPASYSLHLVFFLMTLNLLWLNLFFASPDGTKSREEKIVSFILLPFCFSLIALFYFNYFPEIINDELYFPYPLYPSLTLLMAVISLLMLVTGWERFERGQNTPISEQIFRLGLILWWLVYFFLLARMIFTGDRVSVTFFRSLFCFQLLWLLGIYFLIFKGNFLEVRVHPSPQLLGHATQSLLVLGILSLFFWFEALSREWDLPPYSATVVAVILLTGILTFPLLPFRPFQTLQRIFYHHLYLPEQDFAIEVSHYLKVMRGEENLEKIMDHLKGRLNIDSAVLYRTDKGNIRQWNLYLSAPNQENLPPSLTTLPNIGLKLGKFPLIKAVPLEAREGTPGHLFLLGERRKKFYSEEESLIRFWSRTLGLLLQELEQKEKEKEQEKLMYFSQATSFLLHDAKNLAQLLDLLLKNAQNLAGDDLVAFFQESLPALEQARTRARRILDRLETFQPGNQPVLKDSDIREVLEHTVKSICLSLKRPNVSFYSKEKKSPWTGDPDGLKTVMENLILNGLQAGAPEEGNVEVSLQDEGKGYHIQVKDEGAGVCEEHRDRIFEPFFTTKRGGSGLGLYQARVIVERMRGRIWYEPKQPKGSMIHVWLSKHSSR
ncbi:MAG: ATP-binding protein [Pseudomonadota bacterium]